MGAENLGFVYHDNVPETLDSAEPITPQSKNNAMLENVETLASTESGIANPEAEVLDRERRLLRKIDIRLVPLLTICYFLQYLDKGSIGYASILGIIPDLKLHGQQYSWANSIFFFGYLFFAYPTSVFIVKAPIGKYVAITVMIWALILMLHAACKNAAGLMAVRFFLGIGEATVVPAFAILIGLFYKREEQPARQCAFFLGDGIAGITGGLIAFGIAHINGKFSPWKYLFLIYGSVTVAFGALLFFTLPSGPSTAYFLTPEEKELASRRVLNNGSRKTGKYKMKQVLEALTDVQAWLLTLNSFCVNVATGGLSAFGNIIIKGFGFDLFDTLLLQIPAGFSQIVFVCIAAYFSTYVKNGRLFTMLFLMCASITGTAMMFLIPAEHKVARVAGACLTSAFSANLPLVISMVTSNITGFTKKATVISMVFIAYCVARIIGPQFFLDSENPTYRTGMKTILGVFSSAGIINIILRLYLMRENLKRGPTTQVDAENENLQTEDLKDLTDREDLSFKYML